MVRRGYICDERCACILHSWELQLPNSSFQDNTFPAVLHFAPVVERYTQMPQKHPPVRACEFESRWEHYIHNSVYIF